MHWTFACVSPFETAQHSKQHLKNYKLFHNYFALFVHIGAIVHGPVAAVHLVLVAWPAEKKVIVHSKMHANNRRRSKFASAFHFKPNKEIEKPNEPNRISAFLCWNTIVFDKWFERRVCKRQCLGLHWIWSFRNDWIAKLWIMIYEIFEHFLCYNGRLCRKGCSTVSWNCRR